MSIIEKAVDKLKNKERSEDNSRARTGLENEELPAEVAGAADSVYRASGAEYGYRDSSEHEIVQLPVETLKQRGMLTRDKPRSRIAEEYRMIKRPLLNNAAGRGAAPMENPNLIMVTSSLQGEGKTFTAVNLAISMTMEQGKTVLLVDSDFSKGTISGLLGISQDSPGLIDVLENPEMDLGDAILHTDIPNLRVIPAGRLHERSTELLASQEMEELMMEMASRYPDRIIIFDSPPLLLTTEASVLARLVGQIVFVISAENTPRNVIDEALEHIGRDKVVGMLLNKTRQYIWDRFRYGYAYGYGYNQPETGAG